MHRDDFTLSLEEKRALLAAARASLEGYVRKGELPPDQDELLQRLPRLGQPRACFVTLTIHGALRGCIGSLEPRRPLLEDAQLNAIAAGVHDSRFPPVTPEELSTIEVELSVLDLPKPLIGVSPDALPALLRRTKPGVILEFQGRRSTFLPSVWDDLPDPHDFLSRLCRKQGSPASCWRDPAARFSTYGSIHFAESDVR